MLWIYNLIINSLFLLIYPYARLKVSNGDKLWQGRLGLETDNQICDLWLHAASVGEVKVIGYLINYLLKKEPDLKIHLTTMTRTGYNTALELYRYRITVSFFPFDHKGAIKRTFCYLKPTILVIAETEIWPNLIMAASQRAVPIILINGRMSKKAFSKYKIIRSSLASLLSKYDRLFLKTEADKDRYSYFLNKQTESVSIGGDMKFDAPLVERSEKAIQNIKRELGIAQDSFIFTAGSTRPGEEDILIDIFNKLQKKHPSLYFILAPRHIERVDDIKTMLNNKGILFRWYDSDEKDKNLILVDRLGLLNQLYLASDIAFVGGTLTDIGGHNILEPVWAGCPVLYGPSISNVREASEYIIQHNYGKQVNSKDELLNRLEEVISGNINFNRKSSHDMESSASSKAGDYILQRLKDI